MSDLSNRKARRGFSLSHGNETLVSEARSIILDKIEESYPHQAPYFKDSTNVTFLLPNLSKYHCKFRAYLEKDLIEQSALLHLEQSDRLNWWCDNECMQRLWPLATTGDGNCLLHAASLAMWGFHDRHLTLRHAVHHRLIHDNFAFHRRWLYQSLNDQKSQGFTLSEDEFNQEWSEICNLSFPTPKGSHKPIMFSLNEEDDKYLTCCRKDNAIPSHTSEKVEKNDYHSPSQTLRSPISSQFSITSRDDFYDFLEQIHVFVLAQVIRRPIIIISDSYVRDADGQPIQPLLFGGLYLPLLEKPELCEKTPILLTYSNSHFSALVPMDLSDGKDACTSHRLPLAVPLIDPATFDLLPVHFTTDPGEDWKGMKIDDIPKLKYSHCKNIIKTYLNCEEFKFCPDHKRTKHKSGETNSELMHDSNKHSLSRSIGKQIKEKFSYKSKSKCSSNNNNSQTDSQTINWEKFSERNSVFGAKLKVKMPLNYKEMIENYLKDAELNFEKLQSENRQASIEFMSKVNIQLDNSENDFHSEMQNTQSSFPANLPNQV